MAAADGGAVVGLDDMKKRLKEMDDKAVALREMQAKVEQEMGAVQGWNYPVIIFSKIRSVRPVGERLSIDCGIEMGRGNGSVHEEHGNGKRFEGY
ncbi:hypothetical protein OROMI_013353 [Orobanche minor]